MNHIGYAATAVIAAMSCSCSKPTIDASSDNAIKASAQRVRESLPESRRTEFDEALQILAFSQVDLSDLVAAGSAGTSDLEGKVRNALNGKTAEEVISQAAVIRAEREAREREQALSEIRELHEKKQAAGRAREELARFQVVRSRFYLKDRSYMGKQPMIELSVMNGTGSAVSRAYFTGTLASPGRSVPWIKDSFNYEISGGLEPGEEASWTLAPNMFSAWGSVKAPADAVFTVTVDRLDGPEGNPRYSLNDFDEADARRLEELQNRYGGNQ